MANMISRFVDTIIARTPNVILLTLEYGCRALNAITTGFGLEKVGKFFADGANYFAKVASDAKIRNAEARAKRYEFESKADENVAKAETKGSEVVVKARTAVHSEHAKVEVKEHEGRSERTIIDKEKGHQFDQDDQKKSSTLAVKNAMHRGKVREIQHEGEKQKTQAVLESAQRQQAILSQTQSLQSQAAPVLQDVGSKQTQVLNQAIQIAEQVKAQCKEYSEKQKIIHRNDEDSHQSVVESMVESARHSFAMDVMNTLGRHAIELAENQAELEKIKSQLTTAHQKKSDKKMSGAETSLEKSKSDLEVKVHACQVQQERYIATVTANIDQTELKHISKLMKNELQGQSYVDMQGRQAVSDAKVAKSVETGLGHQENAEQARAQVLTMTGMHGKVDNSLKGIQTILNSLAKENPAKLKQETQKETSAERESSVDHRMR